MARRRRDDLDSLHQLAHLFGSRQRLAILLRLADGPRLVSELADDLGVSRQQLQRPLNELRDAGLVTTTGQHPTYRPLTAHLDRKATQGALARISTALRLTE